MSIDDFLNISPAPDASGVFRGPRPDRGQPGDHSPPPPALRQRPGDRGPREESNSLRAGAQEVPRRNHARATLRRREQSVGTGNCTPLKTNNSEIDT